MSRHPTKDLEGRPHLVIPTVMLTAGVHNGSNGPLFYPAEELRASVNRWNGKPVVVYHPDGGAGRPETFTKHRIGTVFNARFDGHRLTAEAWVDVERVQMVSPDTVLAINDRRIMEVSTGLWTDNHDEAGPYLVARNHHPDHLALLPDQEGACSIADGCGLMMNAAPYADSLPMPEMV